jgi:L-ribulose-5-phosphate 3-epimerase
MHIMVNNFLSIGLYEKAFPSSLDLKEKLRITKKLGFDYLEMSIDESDEKISRLHMDDAEKTALINCMRDEGLPIGSICLSALRRYALGCENDNLRNKGIKIACLAIDLAANLGIRMIQLPGYDVYYDSRNANSARHFYMSLHKLTDHAANRGVLLGFETMENDFMDSIEKAMKIIHTIHSPFLHLYPDAGNLSNAMRLYDKDIREDLEKGDGHLIALHLKDTKCGVYRNLNYGEGDCDFDCVLLKCFQLHIRRFVCELWYQGEQDWMRVLQRNRDVMFTSIKRNWQLYERGSAL